VLRPPPASTHVVLPARVHHRRGLVLLALGVFQLWLWGTRIVNLLQDVGSFSAAFVAVHLVLYVAAIGAGVLLLWLGGRTLREVAARARSGSAQLPPGAPAQASAHDRQQPGVRS